MFGKKSKKIKALESQIAVLLEIKVTREKLLDEISQTLGCGQCEDLRVKLKSMMFAHETMLNLIQGAARTIDKADAWFEAQAKPKPKTKKKP